MTDHSTHPLFSDVWHVDEDGNVLDENRLKVKGRELVKRIRKMQSVLLRLQVDELLRVQMTAEALNEEIQQLRKDWNR